MNIYNNPITLEYLDKKQIINLLKEDNVYLQHDYTNLPQFKEIKWFWNKDYIYLDKNGDKQIKLAAKKTYNSIEYWLSHVGVLKKGYLWYPNMIYSNKILFF